jgi:hypothetical protein
LNDVLKAYYGQPAYAVKTNGRIEIRNSETLALIDGEFEDPPEIIVAAAEQFENPALLENVLSHLKWLDETAEQYALLECLVR